MGVALPQPGDLALTYRQPWASLSMVRTEDGGCLKPVENRRWPVPSTLPQWRECMICCHHYAPGKGHTDGWCCDITGEPSMVSIGPYPFRLWVHAGKTYVHRDDAPEAWAAYEQRCGFVRNVGDPDYYEPWTGVLLGSVLVTGCHHADECVRWCRDWTGCADPSDGQHRPSYCSPWADPDQYHWLQTDPQPLPEPIPMRGRQKLWRIAADDLAGVAA